MKTMRQTMLPCVAAGALCTGLTSGAFAGGGCSGDVDGSGTVDVDDLVGVILN